MTHETTFLLTCEHAVNSIPSDYGPLFETHQTLLNSHRGIDFGAAKIARYLSEQCHIPLICAVASRLLIDCNRSLHHPDCFSEITKPLSKQNKQRIIANYYTPYREQIYQFIKEQRQQKKRVIHLSIHSFTPILNGQKREADIGFLYDPKRYSEKQWAHHWKKHLKQAAPTLQIRMNYPYQGQSDGLTTALRQTFSEETYLGIEIETNQALLEHHQPTQAYQTLLQSTLDLLQNATRWHTR